MTLHYQSHMIQKTNQQSFIQGLTEPLTLKGIPKPVYKKVIAIEHALKCFCPSKSRKWIQDPKQNRITSN